MGRGPHGESLLGLHEADEHFATELVEGLLGVPHMGGGKFGVVLFDVFGLNGEDLSTQGQRRKQRQHTERRQDGETSRGSIPGHKAAFSVWEPDSTRMAPF
jgi:hypothetical protein